MTLYQHLSIVSDDSTDEEADGENKPSSVTPPSRIEQAQPWINRSKNRLSLLLLLSLFASTFCFVGYVDAAPTGIFNDPSVTYNVDYMIDGTNLSANVSSSPNVYSGNTGPGIEIPGPDFVTLHNLVSLAFHSLLPSAIVTAVYRFGYLEHKSLNIRILTVLFVPVFYFILYFLLAYSQGLNVFGPAARWLGILFEMIFVGFLMAIYTKSAEPHRYYPQLSSQRDSIYVRTTWRRIRLLLFLALTASFGGALTFATRTTEGAVVTAIFAGVFFFPIAGGAGFYYNRLVEFEDSMGIR